MRQSDVIKGAGPQEILRRTDYGSIFKVMLLAGVILCVINFVALMFLDARPQNRAYWLLREKWKRLEAMDKPVELLVLGDSSCSLGVDPELLQRKLGMSAMNLCTFGGVIAVNDAWMLQRYIEKFGPPKKVLIVHAYDIWADGANMWVLAKIPEKWGYWKRFEPRLGGSPSATLRIFLGRYIPFFTENLTIADMLKSPRATLSRKFYMTDQGMTPVEEPNPENVKQDFEGHMELLAKESEFKISAPNRRALDAVEILAEKHGFEVYLANSPVYEGLAAQPEYRSVFSELEKALEIYLEGGSAIHYIPGQLSYSDQRMENVDHLIKSAAEEYTASLAEKIK